MIRSVFAAVLAAAIAVPVFAADTKYTLTGDNTTVAFTGKKPDGKHEGGFKKLSGTATVTDGKLDTLKIEVDIETDSLYSDDAKLTTHLKSPDFFGVKDNPKATFKTTKMEKTEKGYTITGELTMLGKTKAVTMPATVAVTGDTLTLSSEFKINKTDWGMNYGKGKIDDEVAMKVTVKAKQ
jgi:polyisoprenoid-binding protein YceI